MCSAVVRSAQHFSETALLLFGTYCHSREKRGLLEYPTPVSEWTTFDTFHEMYRIICENTNIFARLQWYRSQFLYMYYTNEPFWHLHVLQRIYEIW